MKKHLQALTVAIACLVGILAWAGPVRPQAGAQGAPAGQAPGVTAPPQTPPAGGRGGTPGTENGIATFETRCSICHGYTTVGKAVSASEIREMSGDRIYTALVSGLMKTQGDALSDVEKRGVAEFMAGRPLGSEKVGDAKNMPNKCAGNPQMTNPAQGTGWNGWGAGPSNTRFQPAAAAGLTAAQVPQLKLKWAFGYPAGVTSNGQPTIVSGRVFVGSDNGFVYSLDAATGCVYWSFENGAIVRNSPAVGPVTGQGSSRYAMFFGDGKANVFAVDAQDGKLLWKTKADPHFVARITAGITFYNGRLYVPVSSSEEFRSGDMGYPCCTSRGSVVALDANTGKEIWKAWVVPDEPKPYKTMANGVVLYAPAGGSVWNAPTVDPVRQAVYFGTGDATTAPAPRTTDAIMAVDMNTGKLLWAYTVDPNDVFMGGCSNNPALRSDACPNPNGPDLDIGNSPILQTLPGGKRVLMAGTKRGHVFGLDPDNMGALLYRVSAGTGNPVAPVAAPPAAPGAAVATQPAGGGRGGGGGTIVWGGAVDDQFVYYGAGGAGLTALRPATGERVWSFVPPAGGSMGAAPTVIPGVVFAAASNGRIFAVSAADGKQLWEFNTAQPFDTVNKVVAKGGGITMSAPVVAGGMVFVGSGYAVSSGAAAGNVLLAFSVD